MNVSIHHRIKVLIEETNDAFEAYGHVNTDYAEFASMALSDFKNILRDPDLTSRQLRHIIRRAMAENAECRSANPQSWAALMAKYIAQTANSPQ